MHHHKTNKTLKTLILSANQIGMDIEETVFTSQELSLKTFFTIQIFQIRNYYLVWIFKEKGTSGKEKGLYCKEKPSSFEVNMQVRKNVAFLAAILPPWGRTCLALRLVLRVMEIQQRIWVLGTLFEPISSPHLK